MAKRNKQFFTKVDQLTIGGQLNGELEFQCLHVFPPSGGTFRSLGTTSFELSSTRMELVLSGADSLTSSDLDKLLKRPARSQSGELSFSAHVIFDGPKLRSRDSGSETKSENDFLGKATNSSLDTHLFSGLD